MIPAEDETIQNTPGLIAPWRHVLSTRYIRRTRQKNVWDTTQQKVKYLGGFLSLRIESGAFRATRPPLPRAAGVMDTLTPPATPNGEGLALVDPLRPPPGLSTGLSAR